jgi:autotransporter-associated beta strand protein
VLSTGDDYVLPGTTNLTVNGGALAMGATYQSVNGVRLQGGGLITGSAMLISATDFDMQDGTDCATLAGSVGLSKTTGGTVTLSGHNIYSGPTSITGGTLRVNGSIASAVTVSTGGTLGGVGTVFGPVTLSGGNLSPGSSPGTFWSR